LQHWRIYPQEPGRGKVTPLDQDLSEHLAVV
jgi:hypothetical protein